MNEEHSRYKEFLYLLQKAVPPKHLTENVLRHLITSVGGNLKAISKVGNRFGIEADNINAKKLPLLLKRLEEYGEIEDFEAVDNTGKGNFYLKLTLKFRNF